MCEGTPPVRACEPKLSDIFARVQISDLYRAQAFIYVSAKVQTAEGIRRHARSAVPKGWPEAPRRGLRSKRSFDPASARLGLYEHTLN